MTASARKTAPHRRIPPYYEFATHTLLVLELKVPSLQDHHSVKELGAQLLDVLPVRVFELRRLSPGMRRWLVVVILSVVLAAVR